MGFQSDSIFPSGGMDKDKELSLIKPGDYVDALNVQHLTDGGQSSYAIQDTKGNTLRFSISAVTARNKRVRVLIQTNGVTAREVTFYKTNGSVLAVVNYIDDAVFGTAFTNFQTAATAALAAATPAQTVTIFNSGFDAYAEVTITTVLGYEWSAASTSIANPTEVTVLQEAISLSIAALQNVIGSYDLLGNLFIWSSTQVNLPSVFGSIISTADNGSGLIRVQIASTVGLLTGQSVAIEGAIADTNGLWIVTVIDSTHFDLMNSIWSGTSTGTVTINTEGFGEIGVAVYDPNTDVFTYTRLLRSKEFNFRVQKQIDTYCEANNFQYSLYWTDDYNIPRVLYYTGAFITDGALAYVATYGKYAYGSIADETKLIISSASLGFNFIQQVDGGGGIKSGNWRYAVRLLTASFSPTNWTELSNPVNVFKAVTTGDFTAINAICGDDAGTVTTKINQFNVSNILTDIFKYIELAGVNYINGAIAGSIIKRISVDAAIMTIEHTGTETNVVDLDVPTLNQFSFDIETAKNVDAIDNRLIISNLTTAQEVDFTAFTETFTHSINRKTISAVLDPNTTPLFGEYQMPLNVFNNMGLMHNDIYRYSAKYKLKSNGSFTKCFWIDDIKIDASAINITTPNRRISGLVDYNLTTTGGTYDVYVAYIEFSGIDLDFLIDGVSARDLIEAIHFEMVERVPEVLATGVAILTVSGAVPGNYGYGNPVGTNYGEYPYISGAISNAPSAVVTYPSALFTARRTFAKLYLPDVFCGQTNISFIGTDYLNNFGNPEYFNLTQGGAGGTDLFKSYVAYNGFGTTVMARVDLDAAAIIPAGPFTVVMSGITYDQTLRFDASPNYPIFANQGGMLVHTEAPDTFVTTGSNPDYGVYYIQYVRDITYTDPDNCKYGARIESIYVPTGAILTVDSSTASPASKDVFGGDVFTQKSYIKHRGAQYNNTVATTGGGAGISFYSQNVANTQMIRRYSLPSSAWVYPNTTFANWLDTTDVGAVTAPYNKGYTIENGISSYVAFDASLPPQNDLPTQIRYSDLKPQNSIIDNFRVFLPLNFKDLPMTFGEITHHANFNGELFTWQPRMVQRQYFNTRGTMQVDANSAQASVLIGDGSVFSRDGQMVTRIGTYHKWSVIKGKSVQGNDVMYWINTELKKVMRMGYDGTISIGDIHDMQSFFANYLTWVEGKDNPASGQGICGVWDDRYIAAIWTVRGKRQEPLWNAMSAYSEGDIVSYTPAIFTTFEETGEIYIALEDIPAGVVGNDPNPIVWGVSGGPTNETYIIDFTNNVTIGFALWNVDLNTTMADLVTSLNTNTNPDPGNPIWGSIPAFDNSLGYTCSWDIGLQQMTVNTPVGVYASYNATNLFFAVNGGVGLSFTPGPSQNFSGGVDPVINDFPEGNVLWQVVLHTDNNYYNEYTIEFNEQKNKWTTFYSFLPKIFLKWTDTFLTPKPIANTGFIYEHRLGDYCSWYGGGQVVDAYIDMIYNKDMNSSKQYLALWFKSLIVPVQVDLFTSRHQSFLLAADFENNLDFFTAPIKNDILTSSNGLINSEDTSKLFGSYIRVKMTFRNLVFQKVVDLVLKFFVQSRNNNK